MQLTIWNRKIRCINMKWIQQEMRHYRADTRCRMDRQTNGVRPIYPPTTLLCGVYNENHLHMIMIWQADMIQLVSGDSHFKLPGKKIVLYTIQLLYVTKVPCLICCRAGSQNVWQVKLKYSEVPIYNSKMRYFMRVQTVIYILRLSL